MPMLGIIMFLLQLSRDGSLKRSGGGTFSLGYATPRHTLNCEVEVLVFVCDVGMDGLYGEKANIRTS